MMPMESNYDTLFGQVNFEIEISGVKEDLRCETRRKQSVRPFKTFGKKRYILVHSGIMSDL